ncbi:MAG: dihydroorotate dehydrogenase-like protein [FCB group bacterium]|jgi:dihydroorotate dehydrogenase (fumarate)
MDLTTKYLGMDLRTPLVVSASPLSTKIDDIKKMEDSGASAIVLYSLFEEQLINEQYELHYATTVGTYSYQEALTYFPEYDEFKTGPEEYLEQITKAKASVKIPVIASLNGTNIGSWTNFAKKIEDAGAEALELNDYNIPTNANLTADKIEQSYIDILKAVKSVIKIPVAMKLSPFFSNMANMEKKLDDAGADALVLFNRFYQPDIDLEALEIKPHINLSTSQSMRLPLRWIAILKGRIKANLAATSGIHSGFDVLKMLMAGADVTMLCSILLKYGIDYIKQIEKEMIDWMTEKEYESVKQMQGSMSQINVADPSAFERAQYMKAITYYKVL